MIESPRTTTSFLRGPVAGMLTLIVVGVPTDVVDTPWFGREVPVRWWEYPVLAATVVLTAAVVLRRRRTLCGPVCAAPPSEGGADSRQPPSVAQ